MFSAIRVFIIISNMGCPTKGARRSFHSCNIISNHTLIFIVTKILRLETVDTSALGHVEKKKRFADYFPTISRFALLNLFFLKPRILPSLSN
jgi:hypothetical protein